jgi:transposase
LWQREAHDQIGADEVVEMAGETRLLESNGQLGLGFEQASASGREVEQPVGDDRFLCGAEGDFYIGAQRLDEYLCANQQGWVVKLKQLVSELDYAELTKRYKDSGRRPIHPCILLGLIVYGITQGKWALRELERLALLDLGAMWMAGRLQPDHSTIGKFIQLHEKVLSEQFFSKLVKQLVNKLNLSAGTTAMDGTVIAAAVSHYRMLRTEALREAQLSEEAERILAERQAAREFKGRDGAATMLAPGEPEAVVQPTKHGPLRPSYKPSALRHESGLVIAQAVHASSETAVVEQLLEQHLAVFETEPPRLLGDAGYHTLELLTELAARNIDALIPAGHGNSERPWEKRQLKGKLPKSVFRYDAEADVYHCPGQRTLVSHDRGRDGRGRRYRRYRSADCTGCALREQCTNSKTGRSLKRYDGEEIKDAMATVLNQPAARRQLRRRSAIIEPLFADLRERQRLTRFHRRGLTKVKVEFTLHCAAYNLRKAAAGAAFVLLLFVFIRSIWCRRLVAAVRIIFSFRLR